jgi:hypothetical protein
MRREQLEVAAQAIALISPELSVAAQLDGDDLVVGTRRIPLPRDWVEPPAKPKEDPFLGLPFALPSRAHGDAREKLLFGIVQDAYAHDSRSGLPGELDVRLREALATELPLPEQDRPIVAAAMGDAYWATPKDLPYLVPYHSLLPTSYLQSRPRSKQSQERVAARYKLFRGVILLFLCWTGEEVDAALIQSLLDVINGTEGFTLLDRLLLAAAEAAGATGGDATVEALLRRFDNFPATVTQGVFCQPALSRFQDDLRCILEMDELPRRDRLDLLTALLSLHLAVYYYRLAVVLGEEIDRAISATGQLETEMEPSGCDCSGGLENCSLAGRILFRVGTSGDRPVSLHHGCAVAYRDVDAQRLFPLAATIITSNIAQHLWEGLGGKAGNPSLRAITSRANEDAAFAAEYDTAASAFAVLYAIEKELASTPEEAAGFARAPGLFALRESVLAAWRSKLKYWSRDVVNSLAKRENGSFIRTRGRVTFFEVDEDFLFLLVRLICGASERPFDEFLNELRIYGLAPQDDDEVGRLTDALEHLGMLRRYSDAGESTYVSHNV